MKPSPAQVAPVEHWLRRQFPDADVASKNIFETDVQLFRVWMLRARWPAPELAVSYEAFEDHPIEEIVAVLERQRAPKQMRENPGERLLLERQLRLGQAPHSACA